MGLDIYFNKVKDMGQVGYFRKVNFLVGFFENIKDHPIENLVPIHISKEECEELYDRCVKVLVDHSKAEELLPSCQGFFFGNYEYNDYYFEQVENVRRYLEEELLPEFKTLEPDEHIEFYIWY